MNTYSVCILSVCLKFLDVLPDATRLTYWWQNDVKSSTQPFHIVTRLKVVCSVSKSCILFQAQPSKAIHCNLSICCTVTVWTTCRYLVFYSLCLHPCYYPFRATVLRWSLYISSSGPHTVEVKYILFKVCFSLRFLCKSSLWESGVKLQWEKGSMNDRSLQTPISDDCLYWVNVYRMGPALVETWTICRSIIE